VEPSFTELSAELARRSIRPSHQRIKILEYLFQNRIHPTVDQIYHALHAEIQFLSRTTVYNTLNAFQKAGLVRVLSIEDNETRYDVMMEDHGHFKCERCGTITNFAIDIDAIPQDDLKGFQINDRNVYFKGICPVCRSGDTETD
jgi:Fe2+ or Zn2+ uptake regulation protein